MDTKPTWPAEVPILTGKDVIKGRRSNFQGQCCLLGWMDQVFNWCGPAQRKARESVAKSLGFKKNKFSVYDIADTNDSNQNSKKELAIAWNNAMRDLGYTVGNPFKRKANIKTVKSHLLF